MSSTARAPARNGMAPAKPHRAGSHTNGLERERVTDIQRARMLAAMAEVACERGASNVTVAHVVARSGVSRRTFYEQFTDREDCFLAAMGEALACAARYVLPAYEVPGRWRERLRAGLVALLSFLEDEPYMGRLLVVEALGAGERALQRRQRVLSYVLAATEEGRSEARDGGRLAPLTAEGVVGGVLSVLHARLLERSAPSSLLELTGQLMSMIVLPYLGASAAQRELQRPPPAPAERRERAPANLLRDLEMRLTYRTVRVLLAIASHPGASNRELAIMAEVSDQGQISKLLTRLENLGLVQNTGAGHARGAPNAWVLTSRGERIESTIARQASLVS